MKRALFVLILVSSTSVPVAQAAGTDYYVSATGSDSAAGTSPASAWRTLNPVNSRVFGPGDRILLEGGATFTGSLFFGAASKGTPTSPITITSYGTGRATISSGTSPGINTYNTSGFVISDLNLVGAGASTNTDNGICFYNDLPNNTKLEFVQLRNLEISGYGRHGIAIGSGNGTSGFRNVDIRHVVSRDNRESGIMTWGPALYANENVYIGYSKAYNNLGKPTAPHNTGSGIMLGSVRGATVERSVAFNNGALCTAADCGVGIWAYDATQVVLQYNESYNNRSGSAADGDGFDFDQNVTNSVMQYNYAHGNDGAGFLLAHRYNNDAHSGNVLRYNVSENDGRKHATYGGIHIWGRVTNTEIYHNTVYTTPNAAGGPHAFVLANWTIEQVLASGLRVRNNHFQTTGGAPLVQVTPAQTSAPGLLFQGNNYYASGGAFALRWGNTTYSGLGAWQAASGQEQVAGVKTGWSVDAKLTSPGSGGTIGDPDRLTTLTAYKLLDGSPLINGGLNLQTLFGLNPGSQDYYGNPLPQGVGYDVGANEFAGPSAFATATPDASPTPITAPTATATVVAPTFTPTAPAVPTPTATATLAATSTATRTATPASTPTAVPSPTATIVLTSTPTSVPSATPTTTPTVVPSPTRTPTLVATASPASPTPTPCPTRSRGVGPCK